MTSEAASHCPRFMENREPDFTGLLSCLGVPSVARPDLIRQALTHRSFTVDNNERLEFLGDAVLKLSVSNWLYASYPHYDEGQLSALRAYVVSDETLARLAHALNLGAYLRLSSAEESAGGRAKSSLLACALEALIGALFLSEGLAAASTVIVRLLGETVTTADQDKVKDNYKASLQEWTQGRYGCLPLYEVVAEQGPPHDRVFHYLVRVRGRICGHGRGKSKKAAEQHAARRALECLVGPQQQTNGRPRRKVNEGMDHD